MVYVQCQNRGHSLKKNLRNKNEKINQGLNYKIVSLDHSIKHKSLICKECIACIIGRCKNLGKFATKKMFIVVQKIKSA